MREVSIGIEPDVDGGLDAQFDDAVISLRSAGCDDRFRLICRAVRLQVTTPDIAGQVLHLEQVVFTQRALRGGQKTIDARGDVPVIVERTDIDTCREDPGR